MAVVNGKSASTRLHYNQVMVSAAALEENEPARQHVVTVDIVQAGCNRPSVEWYHVVCCLCVPNRLLHTWHLRKDCDCNYIELLNEAICDQVLTADTHFQHLEGHLWRRESAMSRKASLMRSGSRTRYLESNTVLVNTTIH